MVLCVEEISSSAINSNTRKCFYVRFRKPFSLFEFLSDTNMAYITAPIPLEAKRKAKLCPVYKKKDIPIQRIRAIVNSKDLRKTSAQFAISYATCKRIRAAHREKKPSVSEITAKRDRCINEAIRLLQRKFQVRLAHNIQAKEVMSAYVNSVKNNSDFAALKGKKVPCLRIFRVFIGLHRKASSTGKVVKRKRMMKNKQINSDQWMRKKSMEYRN
jgi:hypothetical protein